MSLKYSYICRLCLKQNDTLIPIFTDKNGGSSLTLPAKINSFAPELKLSAGDGLPDKVCEQCACQVDISYKFKLQCENSDAALRQSLISQSLDQEIFLTVLETGDNSDTRNLSLIKHEVKEELVDDSHAHSENSEEQRVFNEAVCDSSSDSWSDHQSEPSSSKINMKKVPKKKPVSTVQKSKVKSSKRQPDSGSKVNNIKTRKKNAKEYNADLKMEVSSEIPIFSLENVSISRDSMKDEIDNDYHIKVQMNAKKPYIKLFHCHDCGKNFAKKTQLVLHMSGHTGAKPFVCSQCGRSFANRINLKKHLFTHTGEKPYLCTRCGISFGRIDTLTKHMRSHTGEKPFHCSVCGNNFARRSTFTNHKRTHSGEKPYLCTECGWRCVQSYDLKKHMRCHTGERPFRCSVCRLGFGQRNSLTKHMRCHVGEVPMTLYRYQI